jgi:hypothetical protein
VGAGSLSQHGGEVVATPLRMDRAILQGVLIGQTVEMRFEFTGHFGWSAAAGPVREALCAFVGKTLHPFAQGRVGEMGDRLTDPALGFTLFTDRLLSVDTAN